MIISQMHYCPRFAQGNNGCKRPIIVDGGTFFHIWLYKFRIIGVCLNLAEPRSNIIPRSHHDVAHLYPPTNIPTMQQLPTNYNFQDIAQIRFSGQDHYNKPKLKSRRYQDVACQNPQPVSLPHIVLHFSF